MINFNSNEVKNLYLGESNWWGMSHKLIIDEFEGAIERHQLWDWDDAEEDWYHFSAFAANPDVLQQFIDEEARLRKLNRKSYLETTRVSLSDMLDSSACKGGIRQYIESMDLIPFAKRNLLRALRDDDTIDSRWYYVEFEIPTEDIIHWLRPREISEYIDGSHKVSIADLIK